MRKMREERQMRTMMRDRRHRYHNGIQEEANARMEAQISESTKRGNRKRGRHTICE